MCLRIMFIYLDMNSIMMCHDIGLSQLILAARSVISNRCLEIQNSLPMLRMHYQCTQVSEACEKFHVLVQRNKQFHDHFFLTYEHTNHGFLLTFVYFLCYIFSRNTLRFQTILNIFSKRRVAFMYQQQHNHFTALNIRSAIRYTFLKCHATYPIPFQTRLIINIKSTERKYVSFHQ